MHEKTTGRIFLCLILILSFSAAVSCVHPVLAADAEIHEESLFTSSDPADPAPAGASLAGSLLSGTTPDGSSYLAGSSPIGESPIPESSPGSPSLASINDSGNAAVERGIFSGFPARKITDKEGYGETLNTESLYELLDTAEAVAGGQPDPYLRQYPDLSGENGDFTLPEEAEEADEAGGTTISEESQEAPAQQDSGQNPEEKPGDPAGENTEETPGQPAAQNAAEGGKGPTDFPQEPSPEDYITPGAASFTVRKEADQESASPGDTVYYTITIRNTGAVILHSVMSTEKFQLTGIDARFLPQDGVRLNQNQTQALIEQITPGESVSLRAAVVIPPGLRDQTLVNQVIVTTRETGTTEMTSNSSIAVATGSQGSMGSGNSQSGTSGSSNTRTTGSQNGYTGGNTAQTVPQTHSYSSSDPGLPPKTGDSSPLEILLCALAAAGSLILISLFFKFRRHNAYFHPGSGK